MKTIKTVVFVIALSIMSCKTVKYENLEDGLYADLETVKGDILLKLEYENTPVTVANFVSLSEGNNTYVEEKLKGKPFYDGLKFHRVVDHFMIQGGDPRGNGSGNPGYKFEDEFPMDENGDLLLKHDKIGTLSMANSGVATNGSQFFITHEVNRSTIGLDGRHTVFGYVIKGQAVVDSIVKDDVIQKVEIIRVGKEAKKFNAVAVFDTYFEKLEEVQKEAQAKKEKRKANFLKFIEENEGTATVLPSGLKIISIHKSNGVKPAQGSKVLVNYAGYFTTGDLFDTNIAEKAKLHDKYNRRRDQMKGYKPVPMDYSPDAALIAGFKEGLQQMNVGDKVLLMMPSHLAYGEQGAKGAIPPNTDLLFELEIVSLSDKK